MAAHVWKHLCHDGSGWPMTVSVHGICWLPFDGCCPDWLQTTWWWLHTNNTICTLINFLSSGNKSTNIIISLSLSLSAVSLMLFCMTYQTQMKVHRWVQECPLLLTTQCCVFFFLYRAKPAVCVWPVSGYWHCWIELITVVLICTGKCLVSFDAHCVHVINFNNNLWQPMPTL